MARRTPTAAGDDRRRLGAVGEALAAAWYERAGYQVLDRNWRCDLGEIDLVCRRGPVLVVCEVKTRRTGTFGTPVEAVTATKQRRLRRLAGRWLGTHDERVATVRFDVVSVVDAGVAVVEDAF